MKYEVPEINISMFSMESIVTDSALGGARKAIANADTGLTGVTATTVEMTMQDWIDLN